MNPFRRSIDRLRRTDEIRRLQGELEAERLKARRLARGRGNQRRSLASRMVWVFGGGRSGTTWLASMLRDLDGTGVWFEPRMGEMFDPYHIRLNQRGGKHFFFSEDFSDVWLRNVREMILDGAVARFPKLGPDERLVVKEPSGSIGAVTIARALPESGMILLVRDPRDVVASWRDAMKEGSWSHRRSVAKGRTAFYDEHSVERRAEIYYRNVSESMKAYEAHGGRKSLVRYEDLRADAPAVMHRMLTEAGIPFDEAKLAEVVDAHSWERIPEDQKGEGKFYRKASPGGWREDLTKDEVLTIEANAGGLMDALGYERYGPDATE